MLEIFLLDFVTLIGIPNLGCRILDSICSQTIKKNPKIKPNIGE